MQKTKSKLCNYQAFKHSFRKEPYLNWIKSPKKRFAISRLRISAHMLPVETGRYNNIPKEQRLCQLCNSGLIGDEFHSVIRCQFQGIVEERKKLYDKISEYTLQFEKLSHENKFIYLMSCGDKDITR